MPWVEFTQDFNWTRANDRRQTTAFRIGHQALITRTCAAAAAGKFKRVKAPTRSDVAGVNSPQLLQARLAARIEVADD